MTQWQYFKKSEFGCKCGCGLDNISESFVTRLEVARILAKRPFIITSGCRCVNHNNTVGGSPGSSHIASSSKEGFAADISATSSSQRLDIVRALLSAGFDRIGVADTFIHVDSDLEKPTGVMWTY